MRIAALYDVHGNLPALEAVLAEVDRAPPDEIVCGGDLVWGPQPAECLALLRGRDARFLAGNCERSVLGRHSATDAWCHDRLDEEARSFVAGWPATLSIDGALFCHGSPRSDEEILTARTPEGTVLDTLAGVAEHVVVCGHTHHQFDRLAGNKRLINPGSVGLPYEGVAGAFWGFVGGEIELRRTTYPLASALERLRQTGFPQVEDVLRSSLVEPAPRDHAIDHFERQAGRAA